MFNFLNISGKGMENVVILAVMAAVGFFLWRYLGQQSQAGAANAGTGAYQVMGGTGGSVNQLENLALLESLTGVSAGQSSAGTIQPVTMTFDGVTPKTLR